MENWDDEDWQEPLEESEAQPSELYSNTGVVCPVCSALHLLKHHFAKGKFSFECPACRRRETNRTAQKKRRVAGARATEAANAALHAQYVATIKSINSRVNKLAAQAKQQEKRLRERIAAKGETGRAKRAVVRRKAQLAYYERVRERMLADVVKHELKPMEHYLQDEELYAIYIRASGTDQPPTAKSGACGTDEPEGMEQGA